MLSTGIPELRCESDIIYLRNALACGVDQMEAADIFRRKIHEALTAKTQTLNDLAHGLAH